MYRRNIYFYFVNFQMKQNTCRRCFRLQNCISNPNKSFVVTDNNQSLKNQQIHIMKTEQSENRQVLNQRIEQWRSTKPDINLAKIVKLQVIKREELLMRKILKFILRDSPRCYRRLSLREMYEKPRKVSRKIRIFHDSAGALVAFYNSKYFKVISWNQIQEISKKVLIGKSSIRNSLKPQIKVYISKYRKIIPAFRSYFARRINVLRNRQIMKMSIGNSRYQKDDPTNTSLMNVNQGKVNTESKNILKFSILPGKYTFARPDRKKLESLMAFYFTKFQEGMPALSDYFSKFSQNGWRSDNIKNVDRNKGVVKNENELFISSYKGNIPAKSNDYFRKFLPNSRKDENATRKVGYNKNISKNKNEPFIYSREPYEMPKEAVFSETDGNKVKLQQLNKEYDTEKSLNDTNVLQSILKNDIETIEKLRSVENELVNLSKSSSESREVSNNHELMSEGDLKKTISEIGKYDRMLREMSEFSLNTQMNEATSWKESGELLKDDQINVSKSGEQLELGNFPDDIINSYRKFKGNYLSLDLIDNALMISTPVDSENVKGLKNSEFLRENEPNNAKFIDSHKETKNRNLFSGDITENPHSSAILNKIDMSKARDTGREGKTYGENCSLEDIPKNSNVIDAASPVGLSVKSSMNSLTLTLFKNIRKVGGDHRKGFEFDNKKSTSSYLRINEDKQFSKFTSKLSRKNENPNKVDTRMQRTVRRNDINCSASHKIGEYPEFKSAVRDNSKRFSVSKILGCDRPSNLSHENHTHSNALKNKISHKKKTPELEKRMKSIKYMQNLLLSNNETSKYHTQSDNVIQEMDTQLISHNKDSLAKEPNIKESSVATVPMLKENDEVSLTALRTKNPKIDDMNGNEGNNKIEASNELKEEQTILKNIVDINKNPFSEFFSSIQEKLDYLQNEYKAVDFNSFQLNTIKNQNTSPSRVLNENSIKTTHVNDTDLRLPLNEKYSVPNDLTDIKTKAVLNENSIKTTHVNDTDLRLPLNEKYLVSNESTNIETKTVLNNFSLNENSDKGSIINIPPSKKYYKNEFDLKCRFDFLPELEKDNMKNEKIQAEYSKPMIIHQSTKSNQKELDKEGCQLLSDLEVNPIQNKEIPTENIDHRNIYQSIKYYNNEFDKRSNFECQPNLELNPRHNEKIQPEPKNIMKLQSTKYSKNYLDGKSHFGLSPDTETNTLKNEKILAENTQPQNISQSTKYYKNEFDDKCRFDSLPDFEMESLKKETTLTENTKQMKMAISRKFSDLVTKLEQMKINNTNWFTQPIEELSNKNGLLDESYTGSIHLHKKLASGDIIENESDKKQFNISDKPQNNKRLGTPEVSKEIVMPSTMKHYFDHGYSQIMDNFKLPDLTKYGEISGHKNARKPEEKLINNAKEVQGEGIGINETTEVSKEIVMPSTMKHYFDHEYSKIMDNFKLPDLTKYEEISGHKNARKTEEKLINKAKEVQGEGIGINETPEVSKEIVMPSTMKHYFDHEYSKIMDNFKLPDLTKYEEISGHKNARKTEEKLINNAKEVQGEGIGINETPEVSKEIVMPSTMKHYFDHEYSKIMDNFKLPDLTKYEEISGHKNARKPEEKLINNAKELQGEGIGINGRGEDEKAKKAIMKFVFDKRPITDASSLQSTGENNKNINLDVSHNKNLKSDIDNDEEMKRFERCSKKLNIDVFADVMNNKIAESVLLLRDIPKTVNFGYEGREVDDKQTSWSIYNQNIPRITGNHLNDEQEIDILLNKSIIKESNIGDFKGVNELTDKITLHNRVPQTKPHDLPTIQGAKQDCLVDKKRNLLEMKDKSSPTSRGVAFDEKFDGVQAENHKKLLITEEMKKPSKKNHCFLTATKNLEFNGTSIHCKRFEVNLGGDGDKAYGKVFKKGVMIDRKNTSGMTSVESEQTNISQEDNYFMKTHPQRVNTMTFVNSDIISNGKHYETLEEDCRTIVGERRGSCKKEYEGYPIYNESVSSKQGSSNNTNIYSNNVRESEDVINTINVETNILLDPKMDKRVTSLNFSDDVNVNGNPQLKTTVSNESFNEDHVDDYDYIYSNIFVNSKFDLGKNLLKEPKKHKLSPKEIYRVSGKQGEGIVKVGKYFDRTNSTSKIGLDKNVELTKEKRKMVNHEAHRNLEIAKLDRLHKVLSDLEEVIGLLSENVENKIHLPEGGRSNADYREQKMMLRDINDSIISSLASLHIFKGNYNKLKLKGQFQQLRKLENNSKDREGRRLSTEQHKSKGIPFEKNSAIVIEKDTHSKDTDTGISIEYGENAIKRIDSKVSPLSENTSNSSSRLLHDYKPPGSNKIVDRFYKYRHRSFLSELSKISEEETVDSEMSQVEIGKDNQLTIDSTGSSLSVLHSSTIFAGSLKPQLNPEYVRKILKQLCTRCVVNEMLQKTEARGRNGHVLKNDSEDATDRYFASNRNSSSVTKKLYTE